MGADMTDRGVVVVVDCCCCTQQGFVSEGLQSEVKSWS